MIIYANEMVLISTKNMLNPTEIGSADLDDDDGDGAEPDRDSAEPWKNDVNEHDDVKPDRDDGDGVKPDRDDGDGVKPDTEVMFKPGRDDWVFNNTLVSAWKETRKTSAKSCFPSSHSDCFNSKSYPKYQSMYVRRKESKPIFI